MSAILDRLEKLLAAGQDGAALRFALASGYYADGALDAALGHAKVAVELDADYSAAWRLLGQVQAAAGLEEDATETFSRGIGVAEQRGDQQVAREMRVFLKRLQEPKEGSHADEAQ